MRYFFQSWINHIPEVMDMCGVGEYCIIATMSSLIISNQQGIQCDGKLPITKTYLVIFSRHLKRRLSIRQYVCNIV